ncbi:MAG: phosphatase PAP2 family protein [Methanohalobium sp.]|uniref:phosphatase PAP2 family protein n=1 Tax=Methanohalobium sp. TaxID=2837493 RepID=UPI00397B1E39
MIPSQYILSLAMIPLLSLLVLVGYYVFIPDGFRGSHGKYRINELIIGSAIYMLPVTLVYFLVDMQAAITDLLGISSYVNYATYLIMIEGNIVSYFQNIATPSLTYISSVIYLLGFPFLLVFTFFILVYTRKFKALEEYIIAFVLIYIIAYPVFVFFPVKVTGHTLQSVEPLLYNLSPIIVHGIEMSDPGLNNCLPSLHTAMSMMAMMIATFRTNFLRYKLFSIVVTTSILFTILYLGIHWITDMVAGIALALIVYLIVTRYRDTIIKLPTKILSFFGEKFGMSDSSITVLCINCSFEIPVEYLPLQSVKSTQCPYCNTVQEYHPLAHMLEQQIKTRFSKKSRSEN